MSKSLIVESENIESIYVADAEITKGDGFFGICVNNIPKMKSTTAIDFISESGGANNLIPEKFIGNKHPVIMSFYKKMIINWVDNSESIVNIGFGGPRRQPGFWWIGGEDVHNLNIKSEIFDPCLIPDEYLTHQGAEVSVFKIEKQNQSGD